MNLRRTIYLTIMSSMDFEEAGFKLMKMKLQPGEEVELCSMLCECCSNEKTFLRYYALLAQRFALKFRNYRYASDILALSIDALPVCTEKSGRLRCLEIDIEALKQYPHFSEISLVAKRRRAQDTSIFNYFIPFFCSNVCYILRTKYHHDKHQQVDFAVTSPTITNLCYNVRLIYSRYYCVRSDEPVL